LRGNAREKAVKIMERSGALMGVTLNQMLNVMAFAFFINILNIVALAMGASS